MSCQGYLATFQTTVCLGKNQYSKETRLKNLLVSKDAQNDHLGTIHLRRQHALGGEGYPHVPMVKRSQYIRIKNPLHKHFAGMPMVGG